MKQRINFFAATTLLVASATLVLPRGGYANTPQTAHTCSKGSYSYQAGPKGNYLGQRVEPCASGRESIALGSGSRASGEDSTALGDNSEASGDHSTALGDDSRASGEAGVALGRGSRAYAENSIAIGRSSVAGDRDNAMLGFASTAVGALSSATHARSSAFGFGASTTAANQMVFGTAAGNNGLVGSLRQQWGATTYRFAGLSGLGAGVLTIDNDGQLAHDGGALQRQMAQLRTDVNSNDADIAALQGTTGNGWVPLIRSVSDNNGDRQVLEITDWVGGSGDKPTNTGYIGSGGIVPTSGAATNIRGVQGSTGRDGSDGMDGADGADGVDGAKGDKGDRGERGLQGEQGIAGAAGRDGSDGAKGEKGDRGERGLQGEQGIAGRDGMDGADGTKLTHSQQVALDNVDNLSNGQLRATTEQPAESPVQGYEEAPEITAQSGEGGENGLLAFNAGADSSAPLHEADRRLVVQDKNADGSIMLRTLSTDTFADTQQMDALTGRVDGLTNSVSDHDVRITDNATNIVTNAQGVATNARAIQTNAQGIALGYAFSALTTVLPRGRRLHLGIGLGNFGGESAVSFGVSRRWRTAHVNLAVGSAGNRSGVRAGLNWFW